MGSSGRPDGSNEGSSGSRDPGAVGVLDGAGDPLGRGRGEAASPAVRPSGAGRPVVGEPAGSGRTGLLPDVE